MKNEEKDKELWKLRGQRVKEYMDLCGLKNKDIAEKLNYTPQQISYIINGKRNLTANVAVQLADLFNEHLAGTTTIEHIDFNVNDLSEAQKNEILQQSCGEVEDLGNGVFRRYFKTEKRVDYLYLLAESDTLPPLDMPGQINDRYFKEGVKEVLRYYGYNMEMGACPDTLSDNVEFYFINGHLLAPLFGNNRNNNTKIIHDGTTLELTPIETYLLLGDISEAIKTIVERRFYRSSWDVFKNKG